MVTHYINTANQTCFQHWETLTISVSKFCIRCCYVLTQPRSQRLFAFFPYYIAPYRRYTVGEKAKRCWDRGWVFTDLYKIFILKVKDELRNLFCVSFFAVPQIHEIHTRDGDDNRAFGNQNKTSVFKLYNVYHMWRSIAKLIFLWTFEVKFHLQSVPQIKRQRFEKNTF